MLFHPDFPLGGPLQFPDGGDLFELIDAPLAGPEGVCPVFRAHHDQHDERSLKARSPDRRATRALPTVTAPSTSPHYPTPPIGVPIRKLVKPDRP